MFFPKGMSHVYKYEFPQTQAVVKIIHVTLIQRADASSTQKPGVKVPCSRPPRFPGAKTSRLAAPRKPYPELLRLALVPFFYM